MGHSQAEKVKNRERILAEAAEQIRETGLEALSVGKLMQKVNLTHGGFYGHFPSRSDLIAQALKQALALVDVKVLDHFIVGGSTTMSFAERGLL